MKLSNSFLLTFILLIFNSVFPNLIYSQHGYVVVNYTSKNGLPQNNIRAMALDSLGFLWMGNESGIVRFDGRNFKEFNSTNNPDIIGNYFLYFFQTATGKLVTTDAYGGIFSIENGRLKSLKKGDLNVINHLDINGVLPDANFYLKYTTPHLKDAIDTNWAYPQLVIFPQSKSDYIIKTKKGVAVYKNNKLLNEISLTGYSPENFFCIGTDVYFFDETKGINFIDTKSDSIKLCKTIGDSLPPDLFSPVNPISVFYDFNHRCSYLVSGYNLFQLKVENNPQIISPQFITDDLPRNCVITSLIYSRPNQFFAVSTDSKGIFIYKEKKFITLINSTPKNGTTNGYYSQLTLDSNRLLTDWGIEFDQSGAYESKLPIIRNIAENIFRDDKNNIWYSNGDSLLKYNQTDNSIELISIFKNNRAVCFYQSGDSILIGCLKNIYCSKNDSVYLIGNISRPESNANPFTIFTQGTNKIWFTTIKGVYIFDTQTQTIDTLKPLYQKMVHNTLQYKNYVLIGTYGSGYYFYKDGKTVRMPLDKNNYLLNVHTFVNDSNGFTWMTTNRGLFKTRFEDLEKYFNDTTVAVNFMYYAENDGINSLEFNGGCTSASLVLKNGYVSLPTMEGLVWYKPAGFTDVDATAPIIIDAVYLDDKIDSIKKISVESSVENIRIDLAIPYWGNPENIFVEYKLEGLNKQWKRLSNQQSSIEFSKLHSGNYTLIIRKKSSFKNDEYITSALSISVEKRFYETIWFALLVLLGLVALVTGISRVYAYKIRQKNKILEENVRNRTIELSVANTQLQQSVNDKDKLISIISHDVVTPLRFIAMVARKSEDAYHENKTETIPASLSEIKNTSEKLYINAQNILNWIKHQNKRITVNEVFVATAPLADEVIDSLIEMANAKGNIVINNISPDDIIKTDENILQIILHNILTNAIKFTANGSIEIKSTFTEKNYRISVSDTGSGISELQLNRIHQIIASKNINVINPSTSDYGNGLGYVIISELIEMLNGSLTVKSTPGKGTTVTINLTTSQGIPVNHIE